MKIKYTIINRPIPISTSRNKIYPCQDSNGIFWVLKVSDTVGDCVLDISSREEITYKIGTILDIPIPETIKIEYKSISNPNQQIEFGKEHLTISRLIENRGLNNIKDQEIKTIFSEEFVGNIFAFYLWIGDEDRGIDEVLIDFNNKVWLIDHGLSGPNGSRIIRSSHPHEDVYRSNEDAITRMCYPGKSSFLDYCIAIGIFPSKYPKIINKIKQIINYQIVNIVKKYNLYDRSGNEFTIEYVKVLEERRKNILKDYTNWISKVYKLYGLTENVVKNIEGGK